MMDRLLAVLPYAEEQSSTHCNAIPPNLQLDDERSSPAYSHLENDQIWLLQILPKFLSEEVCCQLIRCSLNTKLRYTALSYAWGSGPAACSIKLNGHVFSVRKNVFRFLRQARGIEHEASKLYWIDALCINQSDYSERAHQVKLMPRIYSLAEQVLVWLGPSYMDSNSAMDNLLLKRKHSRLWSESTGAAMRSLCTRPYWTRLWIFQELALAKQIKLMCGNRMLPWSRFCKFMTSLRASAPPHHVQNQFEYYTVLASPAMAIVTSIAYPQRQMTLWSLMTSTQHLRCTEVRDRAYALLGVAAAGHDTMVADYGVSLPALLNQVLQCQHKLSPPADIGIVERQCKELAAVFDVDVNVLFVLPDEQARESETEFVDEVSRHHSELPITLWWTSFYGHTAVQTMMARTRVLDPDRCLYLAFKENTPGFARLLLSAYTLNVNYRGEDGMTPIHWAARNGRKDMMMLLLGTGNVNVNTKRNDGTTALQLAAEWGHDQLITLLLDAGALNLCNPDTNWSSPLYLAAFHGHRAAVEAILSNKNDTGCKEAHTGEAHWAAVTKKHSEVVDVLLDWSWIESSKKGSHGWLPLLTPPIFVLREARRR